MSALTAPAPLHASRRGAMTIRVVLCQPDRLAREGMLTLLASRSDIDIVGEAGDAAEIVALVERLRPRVLLLDVGVEIGVAMRTVRSVVTRVPETHVLVRAVHATVDDVYAAARAGVAGYLRGDADGDELVAAIRAAADEGAYLDPLVTRRVLDDALSTRADAAPVTLDDLTEQELEVLRLLARGHSNAELGRALFLSEATIKTHFTHVFRKLGVRDRVQAVIAAYDARLVAPANGQQLGPLPLTGALVGIRERTA
ncbi:MAG: LuxR C-terminal-related transcriptional regulator [Gaiellaceae bacterium]